MYSVAVWNKVFKYPVQTQRPKWGNSELGYGEGMMDRQRVTRLPLEERADCGRPRDFWKGKCALALDLAYLAVVNVSLDYLYTHRELLLNLRVSYKHQWKTECLLGWHSKVPEATVLLLQPSQHCLRGASGAAVLSSWQEQAQERLRFVNPWEGPWLDVEISV